jgi:MoxR-like ATPase
MYNTLIKIRELIAIGGSFPEEFADLAEIQKHSDEINDDNADRTSLAFEGEVYFPKPSNDAQRRIVDKIRGTNGVLVQGPPGTGKSHTIANLSLFNIRR